MESLNRLAAARKDCRICVERDPGQIFNGSQEAFDPSVISYWSQWLGHEAPKVLVVGQDFSDIGYFRSNKGFDEANNTTNDNLRKLFAHAGLVVGKPPVRDTKAPVFLRNSILCLKNGAMSAQIKGRWVKSCSTNHLIPLLRVLRPPIVIGMGKHGWMAVKLALRLNKAPDLIGAAAGNSWVTPEGQYVFAVGHCSGLGIVNRTWSQQVEDWKKIGAALALLNSH